MKKRGKWVYFGTLFLFAALLAGLFLWRNGAQGIQIRTERQAEVTETIGVQEKVDLNSATAEELEGLPGIGPTLAQRILDYRRENGDFTSVEELMQVEGIGQARLEALRDYITVEARP